MLTPRDVWLLLMLTVACKSIHNPWTFPHFVTFQESVYFIQILCWDFFNKSNKERKMWHPKIHSFLLRQYFVEPPFAAMTVKVF